MSLFVGIDSGTQSTKAIVIDLKLGRVVASARAPHRMIEGLPPGHAEQHPREWTQALDKTLAAVVSKVDARRIRGIGVGAQQHGLVPLDIVGQVIRPAKLWCDTSTAEECALLTKQLGGVGEVIRRVGLPFLPGYTAPKILWLKRHEKRHFKRLRQVLLPHDYLNLHLTGEYVAEAGDASGTALFNIRKRAWSAQVADAIDRHLFECLPRLAPPERPIGVVGPTLARRLGFPADVAVSTGGGDNMMSAIGTGAVREGVVSVSLGTSGTVYAYSPKPIVDPKGEIAAFCDSTGGWLPLGCTMNLALVTDGFAALFRTTAGRLEDAAAAVPPGADGLTLVPYLSGERTPNLPDATGTLSGLTLKTLTRGHLARAAFEGISRGLAYCLGRLISLGVSATEVRLTGGAAASPFLRQLLADMFGVSVVKVASDEGAALGAALQAAGVIEHGGSPAKLRKLVAEFVALDESTRCLPDPKTHALYQSLTA